MKGCAIIDYNSSVLEAMKKEGFGNCKPERHILTEDSKEVTILNRSINITPIDCLAIAIRGSYQSIDYPTLEEIKSLKNDFNFFIKNEQKTNGETYQQFIKRRLDTFSEDNHHMMCLYLEDSEGEFREDDKIHISCSNGIETYKKLDLYRNDNFSTIQRLYYRDLEYPDKFSNGILIKKEKRPFEITAFREKELLEIKNFKLYLECDKWYKA